MSCGPSRQGGWPQAPKDPTEESLERLTQGVLCHQCPAVPEALTSSMHGSRCGESGVPFWGWGLRARGSEIGFTGSFVWNESPSGTAGCSRHPHPSQGHSVLSSGTPESSAAALSTAAKTGPYGSRGDAAAALGRHESEGSGRTWLWQVPKTPGQRGKCPRHAPHRAALGPQAPKSTPRKG